MSGTTALLCLELLGRIECDPQQCLKVCECMWCDPQQCLKVCECMWCDPQQCLKVCECMWYVWCVLMFIVSLYRCVNSR